MKLICIPIAILCLAANTFAAERAREIGIEGRTRVTLGRGDYLPKPLDDRTPLILWIGEVAKSPGGKGFDYDLHHMGLEPGSYRLSDYLVRADGSPATELDGAVVVVRSVLPPGHDGKLNAYVARPFPHFGGYRMLLAGLAAAWVLGLVAFACFGRRKKPAAAIEATAPPPTYAERLRPYVERAANGDLDIRGQAELERLLTGYWRDRLDLPGETRMAEALATLKAHPEAGILLRAVERWLHRPGGASAGEINSLLEPYRA